MDDPPRAVLLLAGKLGEPDDTGPITPLLDRLSQRGIAAQVLCISRGEPDATNLRLFEMPALGNRWQRTFAARRIHFDEGLKRPDLLHVVHPAMGGLGLAIADHWKIPYVLTVNDFLDPGARLLVSRRWCRKLIATSRELAEDLIQNLGIARDFLEVVPQGIAIPDESSSTTRRGIVPVIGAAGPLVASAGIVTFLNAARRVLDAGIDAEFVIAGQGEAEVEIRRRASRLRIADRVTFAGRSVVGLRFWRVLDVFCQTSLIPTVGRTLALAMAFGVPAVVSDLEGLHGLVKQGETGIRIPPGDSGALARSILELLADPARTRGLGQSGREAVARELDPETEAQQLSTLYRRLSEGSPIPVAELAFA